MEIKISCPACRRNFTLRAPNPAALMQKTFRCPKCGTVTPFQTLLGRAGVPVPPQTSGGGLAPANPLKTHLAGPQVPPAFGGGHTQVHIPGATEPASSSSSYLMVKSSGRRFPLQAGEHILGRDSADSNATIRLAADPYMSRAHAHLTVTHLAGGVARVVLTGMNSRNVVYVNNSRLYPGSTVELHPGDEILLGMTTVKYMVK